MIEDIQNKDIIGLNHCASMRAWLVCTNQTDLPILRFFKKGFRHCFLVLNDGRNWISIDPMAHYMEVSAHDLPCDFDLPAWLRGRGHCVVPADLNHSRKGCAPIMLFTCVEVCKRVLGIHNILVLTPWQLFRYVQKQNAAEPRRSRLSKLWTKLKHKGEDLWAVYYHHPKHQRQRRKELRHHLLRQRQL